MHMSIHPSWMGMSIRRIKCLANVSTVYCYELAEVLLLLEDIVFVYA
jgi:hypothetical protein